MKKIFSFILLFVVLTNFSFAGVSVIGKLTREQTAQPGESFEGKIDLQNTGETSCQVNIYQTDYLFSADGSKTYGDPGSITRSNASWISVRPTRLTIHPNEIASVHYIVKVPNSTDFMGTYWSMVMIEPAPERDAESIEDETGRVKFSINTKVRYGIQIVTNISETGTRMIKFVDKKLFNQDGKAFFQMDIENTGERWLSPAVWVELYNNDGNKIGRFESDKRRIYPSCSVRHKVDLTDVPKGNYKALVVVDNGDEYVFGAQYDLGIE